MPNLRVHDDYRAWSGCAAQRPGKRPGVKPPTQTHEDNDEDYAANDDASYRCMAQPAFSTLIVRANSLATILNVVARTIRHGVTRTFCVPGLAATTAAHI